MPEFKTVEEASAAYGELESKVADLTKHVATLNSENASHRKRADDLSGELERAKRAGESEAEKKARETVGKEYEGKIEALKAEYGKESAKLSAQLRRLNLEGAAVKAGLKPDCVADAIRLLPEGVDDAKVETAFKDIGKRYPGMLVTPGGGPNDSPGSRGGAGGTGAPRCKADLLWKTVKNHKGVEKRVPDSSARDAFIKEHGQEAWNKLPAI